MPEYVVSSMEVEEMVKLGEPLYIIHLNAINATSDTNAYDVPELEQLLQEFKEVLSGLPQGLPPSRAGDYHIRLEPDATAPASRIYPLSGAQLAELRAQLQELLERGFIRPSTSPFDKRGGVYEVEAIIAKKRVEKSWRYLVKWMGYDETENTCEPLAHVRHLADDVAAAPVLS
eukprot:jgi/Botrbrau1/14007/Bobra.0296s0001.1